MPKRYSCNKVLTCWLSISLVGCQSINQTASSAKIEEVKAATQVLASPMTATEAELALADIDGQAESYRRLQRVDFSESLSPAFLFSPFEDKATRLDSTSKRRLLLRQANPKPASLSWAQLSISELQTELGSGRLTSEKLTRYFLSRIEELDPKLKAFISLNTKAALAEAKHLDQERRRGKLRGPLHGIPFAAKDLFATKNLKTTWGAKAYEDQQFDYEATVLTKLKQAGAILLGKTSLGALAWGDEWFGGQTKNPHNLSEGATGSSAGSASAVSAGLVPFAIGTETWGSLITPAETTGTSALRPSMGRVSRFGVMPLSWTMDKPGVICRHIEDCGLVFSIMAGKDSKDPSTLDAPFVFDPISPRHPKKVHHLSVEGEHYSEEFKSWYGQLVKSLKSIPLKLGDVDAHYRINDLALILKAEASASFAELTLSGRDDLLGKQGPNAYPNYFRAGRTIPAVEYIQMNRIRRKLLDTVELQLQNAEMVVAPAQGDHLLLTNLTGHPSVYVPLTQLKNGKIAGVTLLSQGLNEAELLEFAMILQKRSSIVRVLPLN